MIAGVGVDRVELRVGAERHGREPLHLRGVALFGGLHDPVEQPVEALPRGHPADVRRRPRRAGPAPSRGALGAGIGHVRRRRVPAASRITLNTMAAEQDRRRRPATSQAMRSRAGTPGRPPTAPGAAGWPQRWQNRAWGESAARQAAQVRATRLAPQALQNLPAAAAPQAGQAWSGYGHRGRSVNGCGSRGEDAGGPVTPPQLYRGLSLSPTTDQEIRLHGARQAALERLGRAAEPRQASRPI